MKLDIVWKIIIASRSAVFGGLLPWRIIGWV